MDGWNKQTDGRTGRKRRERLKTSFVFFSFQLCSQDPCLLDLAGASSRQEASFSKRGKMWQVKKFEIRCLLFAGGPTSRL